MFAIVQVNRGDDLTPAGTASARRRGRMLQGCHQCLIIRVARDGERSLERDAIGRLALAVLPLAILKSQMNGTADDGGPGSDPVGS